MGCGFELLHHWHTAERSSKMPKISRWKWSFQYWFCLFISSLIMLLIIFIDIISDISPIIIPGRMNPLSRETNLVCNLNKCNINFPDSAISDFNAKTFGNQNRLLYVHIIGENTKPSHSSNYTNLDPQNWVWADSEKEPFLSLELGYNVFSLTTLSQVIHHMTTTVKTKPRNCLRNLTNYCLTVNLANGFLFDVTKRSGALCYPINDSNIGFTYRCCKWNSTKSPEVKCDIPVTHNFWMTLILLTSVVAGTVGAFYFPAFAIFLPAKRLFALKKETMTPDSQLNPLCGTLAVDPVQALYPTGHHVKDGFRKLFITMVALPFLFYMQIIVNWYVEKYELPKMFSSSTVTKLWGRNGRAHIISWFAYGKDDIIIKIFLPVGCIVLAVIFSFLPETGYENMELVELGLSYWTSEAQRIERSMRMHTHLQNVWLTALSWTENYLKIAYTPLRIAYEKSRPFFFVIFCPVFLFVIAFSPVTFCLFFFLFFFPLSPLIMNIRLLNLRLLIVFVRALSRASTYFTNRTRISLFKCFVRCLTVSILELMFIVNLLIFLPGSIGFLKLFSISLKLLTKLIAYTLMGLILSAEDLSPYILFFLISISYIWSCVSSVTRKHQKLLKQLFQECEQQQDKHPEITQLLSYDDNGIPNISRRLFQHACQNIFPRNKPFLEMFLKLAIITFFLVLTFASIMVFGEKSGLSSLTKAVATLLAGMLPKLVMIYREGSDAKKLRDIMFNSQVKKAVTDYADQTVEMQRLGVTRSDAENTSDYRLESSPENQSVTSESNSTKLKTAGDIHRNPEDRQGHQMIVLVDINREVAVYNNESSSSAGTQRTPLLQECEASNNERADS